MTKHFLHFPAPLLVFVTLCFCGYRTYAQGGQAPVDPEARLSIKFGVNQRFGLIVLKDQAGKAANKQLTFSPNSFGWTNTTVLQIDKKEIEFGGTDGKWIEKEAKLPNGSRSTWAIHGVEISQILEIVPSNQPVEVKPGELRRLLDTCLIRYVIENKSGQNRDVGLRIQVDTLIGSNDGVPFAVPSLKGLVTTFKDFRTPNEVPEFVQALEVADLAKPGTVGLMTLKVGGDVEAPGRVSLTRWPGQNITKWDLPVENMGSDSCVVIYWNPEVIANGAKRNVGFAYGLGRVSGSEGTGKLAVTVNGSFKAREPFTVTAYVQGPVKDQTLKLELPAGLDRVDGSETEIVPPPAKDTKNTSIVTWRVSAAKPGQYQVKVSSSTGISQSQQVTITENVKTEPGKLWALNIEGPLGVGKIFTATAIVKDPVQDQHLTIVLPAGLERLEPDEKQALAHGASESRVRWKIRADKPGTYDVEVHSSTGAKLTKAVAIPETTGGPKPKEDLVLEDAGQALKMSVGNLPENLILDVDGDGRVTSLDAAIILKRVLEKTRKGQ